MEGENGFLQKGKGGGREGGSKEGNKKSKCNKKVDDLQLSKENLRWLISESYLNYETLKVL